MSQILHHAIVGVGSNIEPWQHLQQAEAILQETAYFVGRSSYIETKPVGVEDQADFVNGAYYLRTPLEKEDFVYFLKDVENQLGRVRGPEKFAPRTMDLDLVVWDGDILDDDFYRYEHVNGPVSELAEQFQLALNQHNKGETDAKPD